MKKKLFLVFLSIFTINIFTEKLLGQDVAGIRGIVRDSSNGETIPFAIVKVAGRNLGISASSGGVFVLKGIPVGNVQIIISAVGYNYLVKDITLKKGDFKSLPVMLVPEPVELAGVVSETDRVASTSLANISVQSIDQKELKVMPIAIEKDVMRTLKVLPGVGTTGDVTGQLFIRGGASDQNLIFCDNMYIYNPFHALGLFSIFNGEIVKSADVITGGFDPEYGGRLSSVIKIITRDGNKNENKIRLNAGMLSGSATVEGPAGNGSYLISYRKSYFDKVLKNFINKEVPLSFDDFFGKVSFDFANEGKIALNTLLSTDNLSRHTDADAADKWKNISIGADFQSFISQLWITSSFTVSDFRINEDYLSDAYGSNAKSMLSSVTFNGKAEYQFSDNTVLSGGLDFISYSLNSEFTNGYGFPIKANDFISEIDFYLKYKYTRIKDFLLDFGFRQNNVSFESETMKMFEPRINLRYNVNPDFSVKASATLMHQFMISNINDDDIIPLFEAKIPLKKPLSPERASQYVIGIDARLFNNFKIIFQGYYKNISNYIGYNIDRTNEDEKDFVTGSGTCKGIETLIKFNFNRLFGWITYNLGWADKINSGIKYSPRYDKRHSVSIVAGYSLPYEIQMGVNWDLSSGMPFTPILYYFQQPRITNLPSETEYPEDETHTKYGTKNSGRLPAYHKLDINFSRVFKFAKFPKTELKLDFTNVYDRENIFYYNKDTGERVNMLPFLITVSIGIEI